MSDLIINVRGCDSFYVAADDLTITDDDGNEYTLVRNEQAKVVEPMGGERGCRE